MIPRNLDFFLTFPLLPSPLLMQSLLYSCHFSRYFLFLTSYGLAKLNRICSFLLPACQLGWPSWDFVHPALSSNSLLELGSLCWGTDWSHRAWTAPHPAPPQTQPEQLLWWAGRTGDLIRLFLSSFSAGVAGGAPCCPQDAGEAVNKLEQLFFALAEYSPGSHWMHDFTMSLAFPARLRLCCKF